MKRFAIILAGGEGRRAGGNLPKQFVALEGKPLVWYAMKAFKDAFPDIELVLVLHPGFFDDWDIMLSEMPEGDRIAHRVSCGGRSRPESVRNGLLTIEEILHEQRENVQESVLVAIHDGARALVDTDLIRRGFEQYRKGFGMVPAIESVNSLRRLLPESEFETPGGSESVARKDFVEVQTPQIFEYSDIRRAYDKQEDFSGFTDDASLFEAAGGKIILYRGDSRNIKVTHPIDFDIARAILRQD